MSGIHQIEILIFENNEILSADVGSFDPNDASSLAELFRLKDAHEAKVAAADKAMQPLKAELDQNGTKTRLASAFRDSLSSRGIGISKFEVQPYELEHTERSLESRAVGAKRGSALLVLIPAFHLSEDYRMLVADVKARVYTRDMVSVAEDSFEFKSDPIQGDDPIATWDAADGKAFFRALDEFRDQLGVRAAQMFDVSADATGPSVKSSQ